MPLTITTTTANREIEGNVESFLGLLKSVRYRRFIDVFSGSGSLSLLAMHHHIADSYLINDAYPPIIHLFKSIRDNPQALISAYQSLCDKASKKLFSIVKRYHLSLAEELASENTGAIRKATLWLYLSNRLQQNRPLFFDKKIVSAFESHSAITMIELIERINYLHSLFKNKKLFLSYKDAYDLLINIEGLDSNDIVILDPPYPGYYHSQCSIFFRPEDDQALFQKLLSTLILLNHNKVKFILNYDLFFGKENPYSKDYFINSADNNLKHFILISNNPHDTEFEILFEHIYVSESIEFDILPQGFYPFETFQNLNYNDAKKYIIHDGTVVEANSNIKNLMFTEF